MNRDQKAVAIAEIATNIDESEAIFAVDYRGITVEQVAELRAEAARGRRHLQGRQELAHRARRRPGRRRVAEGLPRRADRADVRARRRRDRRQGGRRLRASDPAAAVQGRPHGRRPRSTSTQIRSLSRLPSREVLYGQLVGVVASPIGGLVRTLGGLLGGLAVALGQVREKKESGEIPAATRRQRPPPTDAEEAPATDAEEAPEAEAQAPEERGSPPKRSRPPRRTRLSRRRGAGGRRQTGGRLG